MSSRVYNLFIATLLILFTFGGLNAEAAKIKSVKGKKVLVDLEGDSASPGQIFSVIKGGKTVGIIRISKVKNNQGLAVLGKGSAEPGLKLRPRAASAKSGGSKSSSASAGAMPTGRSYFGGMGGFNMASADVTLPVGSNPQSVSLSGSGFSLKGLFDYKIMDSIWFRALGGMEQLKLSGANSSGCTGGTCEVTITYMAFDGWARYMFNEGTFRPWVGAGGALLFPLSKESTAIQQKSITNTNIFAFGGGIDWFLNERTYIPLQVEYDLYPSSNTVEATAIAIRGGFALPW